MDIYQFTVPDRQFQTNPCGVEASSAGIARGPAASFRRTYVRLKHGPDHGGDRPRRVSDEPLWGGSSRVPRARRRRLSVSDEPSWGGSRNAFENQVNIVVSDEPSGGGSNRIAKTGDDGGVSDEDEPVWGGSNRDLNVGNFDGFVPDGPLWGGSPRDTYELDANNNEFQTNSCGIEAPILGTYCDPSKPTFQTTPDRRAESGAPPTSTSPL